MRLKTLILIGSALLLTITGCELAGEAVSEERCESSVMEGLEEGDAVADAAQANPDLSPEERALLEKIDRIGANAYETCETLGDPPTTSTTSPPASTTTTHPGQHPPGIFINEAAIPTGTNPHAQSTVLTRASPVPTGTSDVGIVRLDCAPAKWDFNDRILRPGLPRAAHLHLYFGNTDVSPTSDGGLASTCMGGAANHSAYWTPAMVDTATGNPVTSFYAYGQHVGWQANQYRTWEGNQGMVAYYKSGYFGVPSGDIDMWPPAGLRIIAGDMTADSQQPLPPGTGGRHAIVGFGCVAIGNTGSPPLEPTIPVCEGGTTGRTLVASVFFPQCWVGPQPDDPDTSWVEGLDSQDHQSHMAYGLGWPDDGCPDSHPIALPQLSMHVQYVVPPGQSTANWRLASDVYEGPAGYSMHGDVIFNWDPATVANVLTDCFNIPRDCTMNDVGRLSLHHPVFNP